MEVESLLLFVSSTGNSYLGRVVQVKPVCGHKLKPLIPEDWFCSGIGTPDDKMPVAARVVTGLCNPFFDKDLCIFIVSTKVSEAGRNPTV